MSLSSRLMLGSLLAAIACLGVAAGCSDSTGTGEWDEAPPTGAAGGASAGSHRHERHPLGEGRPGCRRVRREYKAGGQWTVTTSCDTLVSQITPPPSCAFDVFVAGLDRSTTLTKPEGLNLGDSDALDVGRDGSIHLRTETSTNLDGFTFSATPGATIELEMYLDGATYDDVGNPQSRFVYWVGDSVLHEGAPTNPVEFAPTKS